MAIANEISRLMEVHEFHDGSTYCVHENGAIATHFECSHIDAELVSPEDIEAHLSQSFKDLAPGLKIRLRSTTTYYSGFDFEHARKKHIEEIGAVESKLVLTFEKSKPKATAFFSKLIGAQMKGGSVVESLVSNLSHQIKIQGFEHLGMKLKPLKNLDRIQSLYHEEETPITLTSYGLDLGAEVLGILKLQKLGTTPLSLMDFTLIRESLPIPFEVHFSAQKLSPLEAQFFLSRRSKQEESGSGAVAATKYQEAQAALEEIELHGTEIFRFELSVILRRGSEAELRSASELALHSLKRLGDVRREIVGALPAYLSTIPGSDFHFTLLERDEVLGCFAPLCARADSEVPSQTPGAMAYHREDATLSTFDQFHRQYESFSIIIIGQSGLGKSVFANTLLRCSLNDPKTRVILVDVKGSHTRTTERLGGVVNHVSLEHASGINPLTRLNANSSRDEIEIVSSFIKQLMLDDLERDLPIKESFQIDEILREYAGSNPKNPSIDDFLRFSKASLPRPEHLARWGSNATYGNVFAGKKTSTPASKLTYYNFAHIMTASSKALSTGVMAAVMAQFSFELLTKTSDEKLIFIADETPFFVQNCFQNFRLLMKNVRKLNGSLVLIAQDHSDLVVGGDPSLLNSAPTKVLFSIDGDKRLYQERLRLLDRDMTILSNLRGENGEFSKFLLVDNLGSRVGLLRLAREEYLSSSSSARDQARVDGLRKAMPDLSELDALMLLSMLPSAKVKEVNL